MVSPLLLLLLAAVPKYIASSAAVPMLDTDMAVAEDEERIDMADAEGMDAEMMQQRQRKGKNSLHLCL